MDTLYPEFDKWIGAQSSLLGPKLYSESTFISFEKEFIFRNFHEISTNLQMQIC